MTGVPATAAPTTVRSSAAATEAATATTAVEPSATTTAVESSTAAATEEEVLGPRKLPWDPNVARCPLRVPKEPVFEARILLNACARIALDVPNSPFPPNAPLWPVNPLCMPP